MVTRHISSCDSSSWAQWAQSDTMSCHSRHSCHSLTHSPLHPVGLEPQHCHDDARPLSLCPPCPVASLCLPSLAVERWGEMGWDGVWGVGGLGGWRGFFLSLPWSLVLSRGDWLKGDQFKGERKSADAWWVFIWVKAHFQKRCQHTRMKKKQPLWFSAMHYVGLEPWEWAAVIALF